MTDAPGIAAPLPATTVIPPNAAAPGLEFLTPQLALNEAATFVATVVGRSAEGAVLLRSAYGAVLLQTTMRLDPGTRVELRFQPGSPPSVTLLGVIETEATDAAPPAMRLDLGTTTAATVIAAGSDDAAALPIGTRLLLRVVPTSDAGPSTLPGQIVLGAGDETIVETPVGTLALDLRVGLSPGAAMSFERLRDIPGRLQPELPPSQASGWPALDQALAVLDRAAPDLAQQIRGALSPDSPSGLAGTLLFLLGAIYQGRWPGEPVGRALDAVGEQRLRQRLTEDLAELGRLGTDTKTDPWRVAILPLLSGTIVAPIRLYLRRGDGASQDESDGELRFVFEAELSRLGALQLDGRMRGSRLDLVVRSHSTISPEARQDAASIFRRASAANGLHGDIVFATVTEFAVAPLAAMRNHVELQA